MSDLHRLLMIDLSDDKLTPDERAFLAEYRVGGVCIFSRNVRDRAQLADYTSELRALSGEDLIVAVDQEGGGVVRVQDVPYPPGAMALGAADEPDLTRAVAAATARGLRAVGVTLDFAPVADVNNNPKNPVIADRAFGSDPEHVARHVSAFVKGLQAEGVGATAKHFPGHGDTDTDSHEALPRLGVSLDRLEGLELVPFRAAFDAGVAAVMSYHGLIPVLDSQVPATLSRPIMTGLLRERLGFNGLVLTDALNMRAVADAYGPAEAAVRALQAGVDMPLHVGPLSEHQEILEAVERAHTDGRLDPEETARSLGRIRHFAHCFPAHPDPDAAWREGDEALLDEAARRALVALGGFEALEPTPCLVVWAENTAGGAASDVTKPPVEKLIEELTAQGFTPTRAPYNRDALGEGRSSILEAAQETPVTFLVSASRTRLGEGERGWGLELARTSKRFVHLVLWNPYCALDLPGPALVTFGFRDPSLKAVARALVTGEATGQGVGGLETA